MADNIVAGLFGLDPYQIQQQRQAQIDAQARDMAQMGGFELAGYLGGKAGAALGQVGAGMLGMVDPLQEQAKRQQAVMQGADVSTPQGLRAIAAKFQSLNMPQQAMIAAAKANEMEKAQQEMALKNAQESLTLARANTEWTKELRERLSSYGQQLVDAGYAPGTPEFQTEMKKYLEAQLTEKTKPVGVKVSQTVGIDKPIEIPKFRAQVQDTLKPYLQTVDASDTSEAMIDQAIKTGNPNSFQGARVQLARAFGDSQVTAKEIQAAGGDPSLWGSLKDSTSVLFTGTPSVETMKDVKRTIQALRKVAKAKGASELETQRAMAREAKISETNIKNYLTFPQFEDAQQKPGGGGEKVLRSGKKIKVEVTK